MPYVPASIAWQRSRFFSIPCTVAAVCGRCGETPTPNREMLTKAERNRKQLRKTTEAARADERGQWHGKRVPYSAGAGRGCAAIPRLQLEMRCVSRTPASCRAADSTRNVCFPYKIRLRLSACPTWAARFSPSASSCTLHTSIIELVGQRRPGLEHLRMPFLCVPFCAPAARRTWTSRLQAPRPRVTRASLRPAVRVWQVASGQGFFKSAASPCVKAE